MRRAQCFCASEFLLVWERLSYPGSLSPTAKSGWLWSVRKICGPMGSIEIVPFTGSNPLSGARFWVGTKITSFLLRLSNLSSSGWWELSFKMDSFRVAVFFGAFIPSKLRDGEDSSLSFPSLPTLGVLIWPWGEEFLMVCFYIHIGFRGYWI